MNPATIDRAQRATATWLAVLVVSAALLLWQVGQALAYVSHWPATAVPTAVEALEVTDASGAVDVVDAGDALE